MKTDEIATFYRSLNLLEQSYWQQLYDVFQLVQPQKPEKGIKALIIRARALADNENISLEAALQSILEGATLRTENRVKLLNQCKLPHSQ